MEEESVNPCPTFESEYLDCCRLFEPEISEKCEHRYGSQCRDEGLVKACSDGLIFRGVEMETFLKVKAELAALKALVRKMERLLLKCTDHTVNNLPGVQAQITKILNRPEVKAILKEGE